MDKSLMILAEGFEEVEALTIVDLLRRAELPVITAGLDSERVTGSHGIEIKADCLLEGAELGDVGCLIIPGGLAGVERLAASERVLELVRDFERDGKLLSAICAGPLVLYRSGALTGRRVACHPCIEERLEGVSISHEAVAIDGKIVTSRALGTAMDLALALVSCFKDAYASNALASSILYKR